MAKVRRKFIKMRVEEESTMSRERLSKKLDSTIESQFRRDLTKLKGSPVCLWQHAGEDCYKLKYYHSYREDMCDTMMTIDVEKGLERCSIHGFVHKPPAIWACFWGVIASVFIDFLIISWCVLFAEHFDLINGLMVSGAVCLVRIYICVSLLELNREKVRILREELYRMIREDPKEAALAGDGFDYEEEEDGRNDTRDKR